MTESDGSTEADRFDSIPSATPEPITTQPPPMTKRAVLRQQWSELAYFHWPYDPAVVQRLLPLDVAVDTFDGVAWVGLIPFEMRRVQLGPMPPVPWLGSFVEINVRTYVTDSVGRRAVWFFSLDVPRSLIVGVARSVFSLPYCWARIDHQRTGHRHRYQMSRRWPRGPGIGADLQFSVGDRLAADELTERDTFLSARWALLAKRRQRLVYGRVHHPAWPLHRVEEVSIDQTLIEAVGLPSPGGPPHAAYSPGVDVRLAWFERADD
jgi:uncharacterized protein YqjF (DUF2071 family)